MLRPLCYAACRKNDMKSLKDALNGPHAEFEDQFEEILNESLFKVSSLGYKDCAQLLLDAGADINYTDENDNTPLLLATKCNHDDLVTYFLTKPVNLNKQNICHHAPLHIAAKKGNLAIVKILIAAGADKSLGWCKAETFPLELAVEFGHLEVVKFFLAEGCDPNRHMSSAEDSLVCIAAGKGYYDICVVLIEAGANINYEKFSDCAPLHDAAKNGHINIMKLLLRAGADINSVCMGMYTVLHRACCSGSMECVRLVLENKDFIHVYDYRCGGFTAIGDAVCNNHMQIAKYLIQQGLIVKCRLYSYLVERLTNVDVCFEYQCPFFIASCIAEGRLDMADILFKSGEYSFKDLRHELTFLRPDQITDEVADWIKEVQLQPWSLTHICRTVIVDSLRTRLKSLCKKKSKQLSPVVDQWKQNSQALELPRKLKQFLTFPDL